MLYLLDIEEVIDEYGDYLLRVAYLYVKNEATAEDIVQDVFIASYEKQQQFKGEASYRTYLVKMTVNRCHDYFRSWKYKRVKLFENIVEISSDRTPERMLIKETEKRELVEALFTLSITYREVIVLYYYEEMSTVEIAKLLNCPESTVRTRLRRARKQLETRLSNYEWEELIDESH